MSILATHPKPANEVAFITLRLYEGGQMGIEGNVGDAKLAISMLESAKEAVSHKLQREENKPLIVPRQYLDAKHDPRYPVTPLGDRR